MISKQKWGVDKDQQEKIVEEFNDPNTALKFIIVTAKLLTGFDSPVLQTMYLLLFSGIKLSNASLY